MKIRVFNVWYWIKYLTAGLAFSRFRNAQGFDSYLNSPSTLTQGWYKYTKYKVNQGSAQLLSTNPSTCAWLQIVFIKEHVTDK